MFGSGWIFLRLSFCVFPFFFFFFDAHVSAFRDKVHCLYTVHSLFIYYSRTVHTLFMHCSWDLYPLYSKKKIKNGSHGTIDTFKNYFDTVFSVFSKMSYSQTDPTFIFFNSSINYVYFYDKNVFIFKFIHVYVWVIS